MGPRTPLRSGPSVRMYGRRGERDLLAGYAAQLGPGCRSMLLLGEAGMGKTTLWQHGVALCRAAGATVLVTRPDEEDRLRPGQGLLDILGSTGDDLASPSALLGSTISPLERVRGVQGYLCELADDKPVVLAIDDLPWLDDLTAQALRFSLRRLGGSALSVLATARTPSPVLPGTVAPPPALGHELDEVPVPPMPASDVSRLIRGSFPGATWGLARKIADLSHGNPLLALELARSSGDPDSHALGTSALLDVLERRMRQLPPATVHLARLLAVAGPTPLPVLLPLLDG